MERIATMLAAPAVIGALWIASTEVRDPTLASSSVPPFESMVDAIQHGEVEDAYAFVSAGADPNAPISFSDAELTSGHPVMISPLMLAVSSNKENTVMMLLSFGARMDVPQNELAPCLARRLGYDDLAAMILRDGKPPREVTCPEPPPDAPAPLLAFVK
jgi:ankyrin repeat protein